MEIEGRTITQRKAAGASLLTKIRLAARDARAPPLDGRAHRRLRPDLRRPGRPAQDARLEPDLALERTDFLQPIDIDSETTAAGLLARLEHALDRMEAELEEQRRRVADAQARLAGYEPRLGEVFPLQGELDAKLAQLAEIEADLAATEGVAGEKRPAAGRRPDAPARVKLGAGSCPPACDRRQPASKIRAHFGRNRRAVRRTRARVFVRQYFSKRRLIMGWLYKHDPVDDPVAYLTDLNDHDGEHFNNRVLAATRVGNTVYMALRCMEKATGKSFVLAAVVLISNTRKHGFGYKDMDETMGPCECACPDRIMRLLSPVEDIPNPSYAAEWRARVAAHKEAAAEQRRKRAALRPGSIVTLQREVSFRDGTTAAVFRLRLVRRKTPIFEPVDRPGFLCRLRADTLAAATITQADVAAGSEVAE